MTVKFCGPGGSDAADGNTRGTKYLTIDKARQGAAGADGVVNMDDGTYLAGAGNTGLFDYGSVGWGGTNGHPFTFQAINPGSVILDGQGANNVINLGADFTTITGVMGCRGSNAIPGVSVALVGGNGFALKNSVFWDAGLETGSASNTGNIETVRAAAFGRTYTSYTGGSNPGVLLEDLGSFGSGRYMIGVNQFYNGYATVRRCYAEWMFSNRPDPKACFNVGYLTGGDVGHFRFENCIGVFSANGWTQQSVVIPLYVQGTFDHNGFNDIVDNDQGAYANFNNDGVAQHHNCEIKGSIGIVNTSAVDAANHQVSFNGGTNPHTLQDFCIWVDPSIANGGGGSGAMTQYRPITMYAADPTNPLHGTGTGLSATRLSLFSAYSGLMSQIQGDAWTVTGLLTSAANRGKGSSSFGVGETIYNTANGAKILNRYVDGTLTGTLLWPFPISGMVKTASTLANGGLSDGKYTHRIIDVDAEIQNIFGNYPGQSTPISISPAQLPPGTVGTSYSQTIAGVGGTGPYTFTVTAGALPTSLSLAAGGALTGTPTAAGTFNFTITATDSLSATGINSYAVIIAAAPAVGRHAMFF